MGKPQRHQFHRRITGAHVVEFLPTQYAEFLEFPEKLLGGIYHHFVKMGYGYDLFLTGANVPEDATGSLENFRDVAAFR